MTRSLRFATFAGMLAAACAMICAPAVALASPIPYVNTVFDTPNSGVNALVSNLNLNNPTAATLDNESGTTTATAVGLRNTVSVTGLSTAAGALSAAMTVTNTSVTAISQILCTVNGYNGTGAPVPAIVIPAAGSYSFKVLNAAAAGALNATVPVACVIFN